jgi:hypothetical protein
MIRSTPRSLLVLGLALLVQACGGSGGGLGIAGSEDPVTPPPPPANGTSESNVEVITYATVGIDGSYARVDIVDGGNPDSVATLDVAKRNFLEDISEPGGTDLNNNWGSLPGSGATASASSPPTTSTTSSRPRPASPRRRSSRRPR